jgi:hypothetical protein
MSSSEANIPTYYTIDSEITVESGWTVKEFFVPEEGIIKRVKAGVDDGSSIFDLAITTSPALSTRYTILQYANIDTDTLHLDSKENIYYKLTTVTGSPEEDENILGRTSSGKAVYLKYYSKLRDFYKTYSDFTVQDHQEAYDLIRDLVLLKRTESSYAKISGNFSNYRESRQYKLELERCAEQHKAAIATAKTATQKNSGSKTLLPIYVWTKVNSGSKKVWYQLDIENTDTVNISSLEGSSSKYRTIPENPIEDLKSQILNSNESVHEVSLGTLAKIDLTPRLNNETKSFTLEETIYGDTVLVHLNGQILTDQDCTFDKDTNSVQFSTAPETTDAVILYYINQPIYNI